jgi:hypothetical protein
MEAAKGAAAIASLGPLYIPKSEKKDMSVVIESRGLRFTIPVGEGTQTVKWLAMVAAQRFALTMPKGRRRAREIPNQVDGFHVPAKVFKGFELLGPDKQLKQVVEDGEVLLVDLNAPGMPVKGGKPNLPTWTMEAYSHSPTGKEILKLRHKEEERQRKLAEEERLREEAAKNRVEEFKKQLELNEMKRIMSGGKLDSQEDIMMAVDEDFKIIMARGALQRSVESLGDDRAHQLDAVKGHFCAHFIELNDVFKHYTGMGNIGCTMSFQEFEHFIKHSGALNGASDYKRRAKTIFAAANDVDDAAEQVLARTEFCEAMVLLAHERYCAEVRSRCEPSRSQVDSAFCLFCFLSRFLFVSANHCFPLSTERRFQQDGRPPG